MDGTGQGSPHQARTPQGPEHQPEHDGAFYLAALGAAQAPTRPHLAPPHQPHDHAQAHHHGYGATGGDDDVDALINSALAAYSAGAARPQGADQLIRLRAGLGQQQEQQEHGQVQHDREQGHASGPHDLNVDGEGDDDEQGLFLPQLPVPPPSFGNAHPAPAPAALPSPPSTSATAAAAAADALPSSSSAAAASASAAPLPSSLSFPPPPSAPAPSTAAATSTRTRGRGPGSRARWTAREDAHLVHLVRVVPPLTWNEIGAAMGRAPTGCSMRWYKFLRDRVARGEMGPGASPSDAAGVEQVQGFGGGGLEPSSEMVVGGSAGAGGPAQVQGGAGGAREGALLVDDPSGITRSTSPTSTSSALAKARPLRKATSSALSTGRPAAHVEPIEPSALPPPLPPSETLPGHPYPLKEGTKLHSNAGKGYLPRDAMVAKPPVPFQPHTVLRGRRTQKAVPLSVPGTATSAPGEGAAAVAAESAPDSASPADLAVPLPPPPAAGALAPTASPSSSTPSSAPALELVADPSTSYSTAPASTVDPSAPSSSAAPAPAPSAAPAPPPKKGKGSKGGLSKAQASVHVCPAEHCTAAFKRSEHLRRHYKSVHRGEKPFPCTVAGCGKTFSRKDNLQQHQAMVHLVRARYTYPDGSSSNDPPEAGTDAARQVVISFDEVAVARPTKAGSASASGADKDGEGAGRAGAKGKKGKKKGERTPAVVAQAQGQAQVADAQAWRAVVPGAAHYSVAPSASPGLEGGEGGGEGGAGGDGRPPSSSAKRARERSVASASASASRLDGDDAHNDGRIDKRLRLTGLAGQDDDALDPALQVLAAQAHAQAQAHAHAHAHGGGRGARSITPSAAFALSGTHALAHAPVLGSSTSATSAAASTGSAEADATQQYYAQLARQLQGVRRSGGGGDGQADMLGHGGRGGVGEASPRTSAGGPGGLAGLYVPDLEAFLDGQLGVVDGPGGER